MAAALLVNSMAGFAFAAFRFPGRDALFVLVLASFMMPFGFIVMPLYTLMRFLGWTDTYGALVLPEVASGLSIFLFRQFFAAVPRELYEAGRIDGATWWQVSTANWGGLFAPAAVSVGVAAVPFLLLQRYYVCTLMHSGGK